MLIGWEKFEYLQLLGFFFLVLGTVLYNEVLVLPFCGFKESVLSHRLEMDERHRQTSVLLEQDLVILDFDKKPDLNMTDGTEYI